MTRNKKEKNKSIYKKIGYPQNWIAVTEGSLPNIA